MKGMSFAACMKKQEGIKTIFSPLSLENKYIKIIELGRQLPPFDPAYRLPENLVPGCQSVMYLYASLENGKLFFYADSEALISKGLAALLILVYSGETPEVITQCPPTYIKEMGIQSALSPTRSNGLASLYLRMQQEALKKILAKDCHDDQPLTVLS